MDEIEKKIIKLKSNIEKLEKEKKIKLQQKKDVNFNLNILQIEVNNKKLKLVNVK